MIIILLEYSSAIILIKYLKVKRTFLKKIILQTIDKRKTLKSKKMQNL